MHLNVIQNTFTCGAIGVLWGGNKFLLNFITSKKKQQHMFIDWETVKGSLSGEIDEDKGADFSPLAF